MNIRCRFLFILLTLFLLAYGYNGEGKEKIHIAVAANLTYAIKGIVSEFNKDNPNIEVKIIIGSSGKLTAQIINGAPFDLFLSANKSYPERLYEKKISVEKYKVYAKGILILFSRNPQNFNSGLKVLDSGKIETIAIANIKLAPYGSAALQALQYTHLLSKVKTKLVYAQNIAQTVQYALTVADAGFIAKSAIFTPKMKRYREEGKYWLEVDPKFYKPIEQAAALLNKNKKSIKFYNFIFSDKAKDIFKNAGYDI